jgi:hypothetical protein
MRGRRPAGPEYVAKAEGSAQARERAEVILETLAGRCSVQQACARLGVQPTRFHQLRAAFVQGGVERLEPGTAGRPRQQLSPEGQRIAQLEQALAEQVLAVEVAQVREEVALILPQGRSHEGTPAAADAEKKTRRRPPARPRRRRRPNR